jgi:hypothetical protein
MRQQQKAASNGDSKQRSGSNEGPDANGGHATTKPNTRSFMKTETGCWFDEQSGQKTCAK